MFRGGNANGHHHGSIHEEEIERYRDGNRFGVIAVTVVQCKTGRRLAGRHRGVVGSISIAISMGILGQRSRSFRDIGHAIAVVVHSITELHGLRVHITIAVLTARGLQQRARAAGAPDPGRAHGSLARSAAREWRSEQW